MSSTSYFFQDWKLGYNIAMYWPFQYFCGPLYLYMNIQNLSVTLQTQTLNFHIQTPDLSYGKLWGRAG